MTEQEFMKPLHERLSVLCLAMNKTLEADISTVEGVAAAKVRELDNKTLEDDMLRKARGASKTAAQSALPGTHTSWALEGASKETHLAEHLGRMLEEKLEALGALLPVEDPGKITPLKLEAVLATQMTSMSSAEDLEAACTRWDARKNAMTQLIAALRKSMRHLKAEQTRKVSDKKQNLKRQTKAKSAKAKSDAKKQQEHNAAVQAEVAEKTPVFLQTVLPVLMGPQRKPISSYLDEAKVIEARQRHDETTWFFPWLVQSCKLQSRLKPDTADPGQYMQKLAVQLADFESSFPKTAIAMEQGCVRAALPTGPFTDALALLGDFAQKPATLGHIYLTGYSADSTKGSFSPPSLHNVVCYQHRGKQHVIAVSYLEFDEFCHAKGIAKSAEASSEMDALQMMQLLSAEMMEELLKYGVPAYYFEVVPGSLWCIPQGYMSFMSCINKEIACGLQIHVFHPLAELAPFYRALGRTYPSHSAEAQEMEKLAGLCAAA